MRKKCSKKHLGRSNISSVELLLHVCHSLAMLLQTDVWFGLVWFCRSVRTKSFYIDLLGVHSGMGLRATSSQPLQRKEKATQWVSLGWAAEQSRASQLPLKTLSPLLPNRFSFARTGSYSLIKAAALKQNYSCAFGNYGGPQGSLHGALSFSGCHLT